ncbi:MAG: gamma carbonic anhydrase family protein [Anaerolineae bacterium]
MKYDTRFHPELVHPSVFVGQGAVIVGQVHLAAECGVWFNATLRGDTTPVRIGARTNIQEGAVLHADPGFPAVVGEGVTIGHGAVIHGATVGDNALIGIRAVLLNGVVVGRDCVIGANSLLPPGKVYPDGVLILGSPAKVVRQLSAEEIEANRQTARGYVEKAWAFKSGGAG